MHTCFSERELRAYLLGELPATVADQLAGHLATCPACAASVERLDGTADGVVMSLRRALRGQDVPPPKPDLSSGYDILSELGRGGMSVVYLARQTRPGRLVALKMVLGGLYAGEQELGRSLAEADAIARLSHPNIVQVYESGTRDGLPFVALEYLPGGSLERQLAGRPQEPRAAAALVEVLARAVHYAHGQGVVHRDLKPANVLFAADGSPKLADFGLARVGNGGLTGTGAVMGTPSYMAPEQAEGRTRSVGPAADVYALGAILYEMLTGQPPFRGATVLDTLEQVRNHEPRSPLALRPELPRDLATVCLRALAKEPQRRYASAEALADDLRRFLSWQCVSARPVTWAERSWRWCRRNTVLAGLSAGVAVLLAALLLVLWVGQLLQQERDLARVAQQEAEAAHKEALEAKRESTIRGHLARAAAIRHRGTVGQRFRSLAELNKALKLEPSPELRAEIRTEALAALSLPDVEVAREWDGFPPGTEYLDFDANLERFVRLDKEGRVVVCRLTAGGEEVVARFQVKGEKPFRGPWLSGDGRHVLVSHGRHPKASTDSTSRAFCVWRLDSPEPELVLEREETRFESAVSFRPGGRQLAVGHLDQSVSIYDLQTRQRLRTLPVGGSPQILAFHPQAADGRLAVACGNAVRIFDVDQGREHQPLRHPGAVAWTTGLAWHPGGRRLATACDDRKIHLWDVEAATERTLPWEGQRQLGIQVAFNRAGDRLASSDWSTQTRLWDAVTGRLLLTTAEPAGVRFSRDDSLLGWGTSGSRVRLYRVAAGREMRAIRRPRAEPLDHLITPVLDSTGRLLAATSIHGPSVVPHFFDLVSGEELASLPLLEGRAAGFHRERGWLVARVTPGVKVDFGFWAVTPDPRAPDTWRIGPPRWLTPSTSHAGTRISVLDKRLAIPDGNRGAQVLSLEQADRAVRVGPQHDVREVALHPKGRWVVLCSHWSDARFRSVRIWDATTGAHVHDLPLDGLSSADFSPDGRWLATSTNGLGCKLWQVGTWHLVRDLGNVQFAFSPDSGLLALSDPNGLIRLVEVETNREVARLTAPVPSWYQQLVFTPDGTRLAARDGDGKAIYVWDLRLIRRRLGELHLDWDWPPYPPPDPSAARPLRVEVDTGEQVEKQAGK